MNTRFGACSLPASSSLDDFGEKRPDKSWFVADANGGPHTSPGQSPWVESTDFISER